MVQKSDLQICHVYLLYSRCEHLGTPAPVILKAAKKLPLLQRELSATHVQARLDRACGSEQKLLHVSLALIMALVADDLCGVQSPGDWGVAMG